jgi:hypothetical protein
MPRKGPSTGTGAYLSEHLVSVVRETQLVLSIPYRCSRLQLTRRVRRVCVPLQPSALGGRARNGGLSHRALVVVR